MRIGMLTPSSNTVVEPVTMRLAAAHTDRLTVHFSRFPVTVISDEPRSHHQFDPAPMLAAARLLADAHVDVIVWNGTSGAWEGIEHDRELARRIQVECDIPATTATLALLELCRLLDVRRYGLVAPYIDTITDRIKMTFAAEGLTCIASANEGISTNADFALLSAETIAARVRGVARASPDAIAIHCTNMRGADVADALEAELGIPVLDSVVVAYWGALQSLHIDAPLPGFRRHLAARKTVGDAVEEE